MTEIYLHGASTLVVDTVFDEMIEIISEAQKKGLMVNIFDTTTSKRYGFFAEQILMVCEFKSSNA